MNILITGGAGYIGSVLTGELLRAGHNVTVLDNFMYGQSSLIGYCSNPNLELIKGDVRDLELMNKVVQDKDYILPLACLTGAPACDRDKIAAKTTNLWAIKDMCVALGSLNPETKIVYPCFPSETKILVMRTSEFVNQHSNKYGTCDRVSPDKICNIKVDDKVLSFNARSHKKELRTVTKVYERKAVDFVYIKFSNGNELRCTPEHPIAVNAKGKIKWVMAKDLQNGFECIQYGYHGLQLRLKNINSKGKTYEEIHGKQVGERLRDIARLKMLGQYVTKKESIAERHRGVLDGLTGYVDPAIGKTYEEIMGVEAAREKRRKLSQVRREGLISGRIKVWNDGLNKQSDERVRRWAKRCARTRNEKIRSGELVLTIPNYFNRAEKKLSYLLRSICPGEFKYNGDGRVLTITGYSPDFVNVNGQKKIIEMYGCRWHGCKKCANGAYFDKNLIAKDGKRLQRIKNCGWQPLIIWEHELKDLEKVRQKIKKFVYNPNVEIVKVVEVLRYSRNEPVKVYNLEIEGNDNYFAYGVLVHNCTNSGYGIGQESIYCTEETPLTPISFYGRLKCAAEAEIMTLPNAVALRLATVFGPSPRMRIDLLVNDMVYRAVSDGYIVLYEAHFKRNYIHVLDVAGAFIHCLENWDKTKGQVFNVGLSAANLSKLELCQEIQKQLSDFTIYQDGKGKDPDKRNYIVSNEKIEKTGWKPTKSLQDGIAELIKAYQMPISGGKNC